MGWRTRGGPQPWPGELRQDRHYRPGCWLGVRLGLVRSLLRLEPRRHARKRGLDVHAHTSSGATGGTSSGPRSPLSGAIWPPSSCSTSPDVPGNYHYLMAGASFDGDVTEMRYPGWYDRALWGRPDSGHCGMWQHLEYYYLTGDSPRPRAGDLLWADGQLDLLAAVSPLAPVVLALQRQRRRS